MSPSSLIIYLFSLILSTNSTPHILKDGEQWSDDYEMNDNAIDGWKHYAMNDDYEMKHYAAAAPVMGSDRTYHGWFYLIFELVSYGYFYRQFQCEYDSFINVSFSAYFGCKYDRADGAILYLNHHMFHHQIQNETAHNYTDSIAVNQSLQCWDDFHPGDFIGFTAHDAIEVAAYTTVDVGFRLENVNLNLPHEFGAISDIKIQCNKRNTSQISPPEPPSSTNSINITDPSQHIACSQNDINSCTQSVCTWNEQKCTCNGSAGVDILFAVGISSVFASSKQEEFERWLTEDIITNIDHEQSRFGLLSFVYENVNVSIDITVEHTRDELAANITNVPWVKGRPNYPLLFPVVMEQFNNIEAPNEQQILVIVTNNIPKEESDRYPEQTIVCHYRNLLAASGIRVIMVLINDHMLAHNDHMIENFECITTYPFDLIFVDDGSKTSIEYDLLHVDATDVLSASLCPKQTTTSSTTTTTDSPPTTTDLSTTTEEITTADSSPTTTDLSTTTEETTTTESPPTTTNLPTTTEETATTDLPTTTAQTTTTTTKTSTTIVARATVDFTIKTDANTTERTVISIVAVIVNITGLDSTQITVVSTAEGLRVSIVGTNGEITLAEKRVDEIEEGIEELTGYEAEVTHIHRTYSNENVNSDDDDDKDNEIKQLLFWLIIAVSVLILVVVVVSCVCCYCLFVKKKPIKLKNDTQELAAPVAKNMHRHASIPSKTVTANDNSAVAINMFGPYPVTNAVHAPNNSGNLVQNAIHEANYSGNSVQNAVHAANYSGHSVQRMYTNTSVHRLTIDSTVSEAPIQNEGDLSVIVAAAANDAEEEELNKLYYEQLALEKEITITEMTIEPGRAEGAEAATGSNRMTPISDDDDNDDMYIKPDRGDQETPRFAAQASFPIHMNMNHLMHQNSFNLVMMNPHSSINLSPNVTPVHSAQNTMNLNDWHINEEMQELSQNLPLPSEHEEEEKEEDDDDDDVIQDMTPQGMHPLDCDDISHEDLYGKGEQTKQETADVNDDDDDDADVNEHDQLK